MMILNPVFHSTHKSFLSADEAGEYTVIMSNYTGSSGNYELTISYTDGDNVNTQTGGTTSTSDLPNDEFYTGYMGDDVSDDRYTIYLEAGQGVIITAEAAAGSSLDTLIGLEDSSGTIVEQNDDNPAGGTLNSQIIFVAQESGEYTVIMSNYH